MDTCYYYICSRLKTNGSYKLCAKMDPLATAYSNKVVNRSFFYLDNARSFISENGEKNRAYFICRKYIGGCDDQLFNNDITNASNEFIAIEKYIYFEDDKWTRMQLFGSKPYYENKRRFWREPGRHGDFAC